MHKARAFLCMASLRNCLASAPLVLLPFLVSCACARALPTPVPQEERRPLSVHTADRTGTGADSLFSEELRQALERDFIYDIQLDRDRGSQPAWRLTIVPNPFRAGTGGDTSAFGYRAELERSEYLPGSHLKSVVGAYVALGVFGAIHQGKDNQNTYAAALTYRCYAGTMWTSTGEAPIVVRGAGQGDVRKVTRLDLTIAATRDAVRLFLFEAVQRAESNGLPIRRRWHDYYGSEARALKALQALQAGPHR